MADPLSIDLVAPSRQVPFSETFSFLGEDYTGSTLKLQVRATPGTTGTALITRATGSGLSIPYAGTAIVSAHVTAGRLLADGDDNIYDMINPATGVLYQPGDSLALSEIRITFTTTNLTAVPMRPAEERGDPAFAYYDLIRTPASGDPVLQMKGKLVIDPGVTIP